MQVVTTTIECFMLFQTICKTRSSTILLMFFRMIFDYSKGLQNCDVNSLIIRNIVGILDNDIFELLDIMSSSYDNIIIIIMIIIIIIIIIIILLLLLL